MALTTLAEQSKTVINKNQSENIPIDQAPNLVGLTLSDRYQVQTLKNVSSGESYIYEALDLQTGISRVIKQYRRKNAVKNDVIEILKSIDNINVVRVLDDGFYEGYQYVVLPLYRGKSLRDYLNDGVRFDLKILREFISDLNNTLILIHNHNLIHKDLKPENIIISEPDNNIVLIDFGISTDLGDKTVVLTQTGKTPFYAAPETNQGIYTIEADYYAFGIMVYELFTGVTPFQNNFINPDNIAAFSLISKIPFPDNFPPELKALVTGLTYNDLSNRRDLNNPNRRWTSKEVDKWLKGEFQPIPGEGVQEKSDNKQGDFAIPYFFKNKRLFTYYEIADAFLSDISAAINEIGRGFLTRHFEQNNDFSRVSKTKKAESALNQNKVNDHNKCVVYRLMYQIIPNLKTIYWNSYKFDSLYDYANALIDVVIKKVKDHDNLIDSALFLIKNSVLETYVNYQIKNELKDSLLVVMKSNKELINTTPLDRINQALRVAYSLTQREDFFINHISFKDINEFNQFLDSLYEKNLSAYVTYLDQNKEELETHKKLLVGDTLNRFNKHFTQQKSILTIKQFVFRNPEEMLDYIEQLWDQNKLSLLYNFFEKAHKILEKYKDHLLSSKQDSYIKALEYQKSLIKVDEHFFKNIDAFKQYANTLVESDLKVLDQFITMHQQAFKINMEQNENLKKCYEYLRELSLQKIIYKSEDQHQVLKTISKEDRILDLLKLEIQELEIGQKVKFGSFFQKFDNEKEPLIWKILDIKDHEVLLLSQKGIIFKPYNDFRENVSWNQSTLCSWANNYFYDEAFNSNEKKSIVDTKKSSIIRKETDLKTFSSHVFLLDLEEITKYLPKAKDRDCFPTDYAIRSKASENINDHKNYTKTISSKCIWWLRSTFTEGSYYNEHTKAHVVFLHGEFENKFDIFDKKTKEKKEICENGKHLDSLVCIVRPAICVSIKQ